MRGAHVRANPGRPPMHHRKVKRRTVNRLLRGSGTVYGRRLAGIALIVYVGQTEAVKTVEVRARVEGFIERQVVPDGATVKAGDVLFTIDPRPLRGADVQQPQANLAVAGNQ